jgi:uncharacterized protein YgbK (DUF1537 family)
VPSIVAPFSRSKSATFAALPPPWPKDVLPALAKAAASAAKLVVLDDDPTGTQTVHDITVVTEWSIDTLAAELTADGPGFYILTNSRALAPAATAALHHDLAANLLAASARTGVAFSVFSRSDSTLRGHFPLEIDVLDDALGPFDGTLLAPYFEAGGRLTLDGVHYVVEGDQLTPAADTPFARDATFGYRNSFLPAWVEEKTSGRVRADDAVILPLALIRSAGPDGVARALASAPRGALVAVDAVERRDIEVVALGLLHAERAGKKFIGRTAASIVAARIGLAPRALLEAKDFPAPAECATTGGLIVVGSYVPKTTAQLRHLRASVTHELVELSAPAVLDPARRAAAIAAATHDVNAHLAAGQLVVLATSRELITGDSPEQSLAIINEVSSALVAVVRALAVRPRFFIAKGGITSSDVATAGLGVRRARVQGQLLPGVPVWRLGAESKFPDLNYVVFPGNVGGNTALVDALTRLQTPAP